MKLGGEYAVHLHKNGELFSFLPGDDVPDWAVSRIDNPTVWESGAKAAAEPAAAESSAQADAERSPEPDDIGEGEDGAPPRSGIGASRQAWVEHAASKGIAVEPDWKRDDIIAAVEQSGH